MDTAQEPRRIAPWPLGFAHRLPHPKLTVPLATGTLTLGYFVASGAWLPETFSTGWNSSLQITGAMLTFTLMLTWLSGFFLHTSSKTLEYVEELRPQFAGPEADALIAQLNRIAPWRLGLATIAGFAIGSFNIDWGVVFKIGTHPTWPMDLSLAVGSMAVWIIGAQLLYAGAHNASLLSRLGRSHLKVDLFQTDRLKPLARVGILYVLMIMGTLAITPLQALDAEFRWYNYSWAFAVTLPAGLFLLVIPMWGVHRRLQHEKAVALTAIEAEIEAADRGQDAGSLAYLNSLLERRAHLRAVHTWPMDVAGVSRVVFYVVIPPLAWVGAALVELGVDAMVRAG